MIFLDHSMFHPKQYVAIFVTSMGLLLPAMVPAVSGQSVPSSVEILASTCGLEFNPDPPQIDYGQLFSGQISEEQSLQITNTGNSEGQASISGTNWVGAPDPDIPDEIVVIPVGSTKYSDAQGFAYTDKTSLTQSSAVLSSSMQPGGSMDLYFQLKADLAQPYSGTLSQTVNFTVSC
jgi:hypothetical protein